MNSELKQKVDEFIDEFLKVKEVKQFLLIKKQLEESNEIKQLQTDLKAAQKRLALSLHKPEYEDNKKEYFRLKNEFDNHPLVTNYNILKEEVDYLVNELKKNLE